MRALSRVSDPARCRPRCAGAALQVGAVFTRWWRRAAGGLPAWAQAGFPTRPVRIVPFGTAGGPIDTLARVYADKLAQPARALTVSALCWQHFVSAKKIMSGSADTSDSAASCG